MAALHANAIVGTVAAAPRVATLTSARQVLTTATSMPSVPTLSVASHANVTMNTAATAPLVPTSTSALQVPTTATPMPPALTTTVASLANVITAITVIIFIKQRLLFPARIRLVPLIFRDILKLLLNSTSQIRILAVGIVFSTSKIIILIILAALRRELVDFLC